MKTILLCLFLCASLHAADHAVLQAKDDAAHAALAASVPEWPTRQQPLRDGEAVSAPWQRLTGAQVEALKAQHAAAKAAYDASRPDDPETAARKSDIQTLKTFLAAANGSSTNAQRDAVLKALIRLAAQEAKN